jgi:hypothetical protein
MEWNDRRPKRDDDVPIIGDFSAVHDERIGLKPRREPKRPLDDAAPQRAAPQTRQRPEQWRLDPNEVRRHARRMRERSGGGAFARIFRFALAAAAVAAVVYGYRNFDAVRSVALEVPALARLIDRSTDGGAAPELPRDEQGTILIEGDGVAGVPLATSVDGAGAADDEPAAEAPAAAAPAAAAPPVAAERTDATSVAPPPDEVVAAAPAEPAPPPAPEPPPEPETFELGSAVVNVSEAAASARVLILRNGDWRRASSVVWSTRDGTATAGSDYIDRGAVVERFAAGEQNRTILVPIVGDRNAEGPESFYVVLAPEEGAVGERLEAEVVISDDD